jgi:hypothetical protein
MNEWSVARPMDRAGAVLVSAQPHRDRRGGAAA